MEGSKQTSPDIVLQHVMEPALEVEAPPRKRSPPPGATTFAVLAARQAAVEPVRAHEPEIDPGAKEVIDAPVGQEERVDSVQALETPQRVTEQARS